ncbi:DUF2141 domain-containing protein [Wenxinia saemankumensis]|uniref:Uncharacterized conserved protein, DUF2141 family n=1 Tax=Wenxinia saemankumensis TaxID=1447782 RepID=A0A1M6FVD9_9RHOB|nr:DUF2141 domain-containing protein [Wenxinia saemankumensis]SHJ01676.1 Uncharacterized conserved protein, DUF2141 family [Wenxinia saemankumensis]
MAQFGPPSGPFRRRATLAVALLAFPALAAAQTVSVEVSGLRSGAGIVYAALCTEAEFTQPSCAWTGSAPAAAGPVTVTIEGAPPGTYAVQVIHDENGNGTLDRSGFLPDEGMGFSRDAPMRMGPPRFADAAFELGPGGARVPLTLRYFR